MPCANLIPYTKILLPKYLYGNNDRVLQNQPSLIIYHINIYFIVKNVSFVPFIFYSELSQYYIPPKGHRSHRYTPKSWSRMLRRASRTRWWKAQPFTANDYFDTSVIVKKTSTSILHAFVRIIFFILNYNPSNRVILSPTHRTRHHNIILCRHHVYLIAARRYYSTFFSLLPCTKYSPPSYVQYII